MIPMTMFDIRRRLDWLLGVPGVQEALAREEDEAASQRAAILDRVERVEREHAERQPALVAAVEAARSRVTDARATLYAAVAALADAEGEDVAAAQAVDGARRRAAADLHDLGGGEVEAVIADVDAEIRQARALAAAHPALADHVANLDRLLFDARALRASRSGPAMVRERCDEIRAAAMPGAAANFARFGRLAAPLG